MANTTTTGTLVPTKAGGELSRTVTRFLARKSKEPIVAPLPDVLGNEVIYRIEDKAKGIGEFKSDQAILPSGMTSAQATFAAWYVHHVGKGAEAFGFTGYNPVDFSDAIFDLVLQGDAASGILGAKDVLTIDELSGLVDRLRSSEKMTGRCNVAYQQALVEMGERTQVSEGAIDLRVNAALVQSYVREPNPYLVRERQERGIAKIRGVPDNKWGESLAKMAAQALLERKETRDNNASELERLASFFGKLEYVAPGTKIEFGAEESGVLYACYSALADRDKNVPFEWQDGSKTNYLTTDGNTPHFMRELKERMKARRDFLTHVDKEQVLAGANEGAQRALPYIKADLTFTVYQP